MRRVLQIDSHTAFQLAAARAVIAGGLAALLLHHLPGWPGLSGLLSVLLLGAALLPPRSLRQGALLVLLSVLAAAAGGLPQPLIGALASALALGVYVGFGGPPLPRLQQLGTALFAALLGLGASYLPGALGTIEALGDLPGALPKVLCGMGVGLIVSGAALLRRLRLRTDPVDQELLGLLPAAAAEDEIGRLVRQSFDTYREVAEVLEPHPQARAAAEELVKKIARFGRKWRDIEAQAQRVAQDDLEGRQRDLAARLEATTDEQARGEYERALAGLQAQLDYLKEIAAGRERAVARLHNQVATLGRLRLAALRHRSIDAGRLGEELKAVVEDLGRAGQDLDAAAEALAEAPV